MFNVIVDTREKMPWSFPQHIVNDVVVRKLDTGDYTIEEFESILCIERKKSTTELANNITQKRFWNEIERMSRHKYAYLIFEFTMANLAEFPRNSYIPKKDWHKLRVNANFMISRVEAIQKDYNIKVLFCGDKTNASLQAITIMLEVYKLENGRQADSL